MYWHMLRTVNNTHRQRHRTSLANGVCQSFCQFCPLCWLLQPPLHATDVFLSHSNRQESTCIEKKNPAFPQEWCTKPGLHTADAKASPSAISSLRHMDLERLKSEACLAWSVHTTLDEEREPAVYKLKKSVCKLKNGKSYSCTRINW